MTRSLGPSAVQGSDISQHFRTQKIILTINNSLNTTTKFCNTPLRIGLTGFRCNFPLRTTNSHLALNILRR